MSTGTHPKRPPFFATKFIRVASRSTAAMDIGAEGLALLAVIVSQEDAIRYREPVKFYNEQLMALCGFGSRKRLVSARAKAVEFGWLNYQGGSKGIPGRYFVTVPDHLSDVSDAGCDETDNAICRSDTEHQTEQQTTNEQVCRSDSELKRDTKRNSKGTPSIPIPIPIPKEGARTAKPKSLNDVLAYAHSLTEKHPGAESYAERFYDHYESNGWRQGKGNGRPIKDWQAAFRGWCGRQKEFSGGSTAGSALEPKPAKPMRSWAELGIGGAK